MPPASPGGAWSRFRDNSARHLIGVARDVQGRVALRLAEESGHRDLRPSFGPLLSLIWDEGLPLAAVAGELAISPQAASQLANLAQAAGYLERRPNPADRRSRLLVLTPRGRGLVEEAVRIILESESEYAALVGAAPYRRFTDALAALHDGLGLPAHPDAALMARASRSVGVLPMIAVRIERELMEATLARGHAGLKMSFGQVLPLIGPEGGRVHEMARIHGVTRQAISAIAQELVAAGYLRRRKDPRDRRGVVFGLTARGERLIRDSVAAVDELEASFRGIVGARRMGDLCRVARDLYHALHLEAEIFGEAEARVPSDGAARESSRNGHDIQRLASGLRRRLGRGDAARLAALLETGSDSR